MNQDDFFENETLGTAFLFIPMDLDHETAEQKMGCETFREELEQNLRAHYHIGAEGDMEETEEAAAEGITKEEE